MRREDKDKLHDPIKNDLKNLYTVLVVSCLITLPIIEMVLSGWIINIIAPQGWMYSMLLIASFIRIGAYVFFLLWLSAKLRLPFLLKHEHLFMRFYEIWYTGKDPFWVMAKNLDEAKQKASHKLDISLTEFNNEEYLINEESLTGSQPHVN